MSSGWWTAGGTAVGTAGPLPSLAGLGSAHVQDDDIESYLRVRNERLASAADRAMVDDEDAATAITSESMEVDAASVNIPIPTTNAGYRLLARMGWTAGTGLGRHGSGRTEPIPFASKNDMLGIGKAEQDDQMLDETAAKRRLLESEVEETDELRQKRMAKAAKEDTIRKDVADILKPFHCELCSKQYKMASEYEAHLSSYDHNHKKRLRDMQQSEAGRGKDDARRRDQKREERELAKVQELAAAAATAAASVVPPAGDAAGGLATAGGPAPIALTEARQAFSFSLSSNRPGTAPTALSRPASAAPAAKAALKRPSALFNADDDDD